MKNVTTTLITSGGDVNARDEWGKTPLIIACCYDNPETITTLLANGADVNARDKWGRTALMYACSNNENPNIITALIANGADVNARDEYGRTALIMASLWNENPEIITALIDAGADVNAQTEDGHSPLIEAVSNPNHGVMATLLANGADPKAKNTSGKTAYDIMQDIEACQDTPMLRELQALT